MVIEELRLDPPAGVDLVATAEHGVVLLEYLVDYDSVLLIDAILTGTHEPGTILELVPKDLKSVSTPSPHYTGLPELITLANSLQLHFPDQILILAVEVADPLTVGGSMDPRVLAVLPELVNHARNWCRIIRSNPDIS